MGANGSGKSTFLEIACGHLAPDTGKVVWGETLKIGYYTQEGLEVQPGQRVIDVIREFGDYIPLKKGRELSAQQLLERFLFDRKQQYDFTEKLSGGERKRLFLCTVLIQNPNFLILDEPTNDLDIITLNVLENFLLDYPGTLLIVSHDRYFMDKITDHLLLFGGDGTIEDFPGNYSDLREFRQLEVPGGRTESRGEKFRNSIQKQNAGLNSPPWNRGNPDGISTQFETNARPCPKMVVLGPRQQQARGALPLCLSIPGPGALCPAPEGNAFPGQTPKGCPGIFPTEAHRPGRRPARTS